MVMWSISKQEMYDQSHIPAANDANRSSLPSVLTRPTVNMDKARYCATSDSLSIKPFR